MKPSISLTIFVLFLVCRSTSAKKPKKIDFDKQMFYVSLYSGKDPISMLALKFKRLKMVRVQLNKQRLKLRHPLEKKKVFGKLDLKLILDKKLDNPSAGKCCSRLILKNYQRKISRRRALRKRFNLNSLLTSNYCLEINSLSSGKWRLCSDKFSHVSKLQSILTYNTIKLFNPKIKTKEFLKKGMNKVESEVVAFNWDDQKKWAGGCSSNSLQSPINMEKKYVKKSVALSVEYNFYDVNVKIVRRYNENVVNFVNNPGLIKVYVKGGSPMIFKPRFISFRFPSEHLINGKRFPGEIIINCSDLLPDKKSRRSNGLNLVIPVRNKAKYSNMPALEGLNMDFWKSDPKEHTHTPVDYITSKNTVFKLSQLIQTATEKSGYLFYLGSQTVPPCKDNVFHLYLTKALKISNCQFKLLRKNSIVSDRPKEIHARLAQPSNKRSIYALDKIVLNSNLDKHIPSEYFDLNEEMYGKNLVKKKLSNVAPEKVLGILKKIAGGKTKLKNLKDKTVGGVGLKKWLGDGEELIGGEMDC